MNKSSIQKHQRNLRYAAAIALLSLTPFVAILQAGNCEQCLNSGTEDCTNCNGTPTTCQGEDQCCSCDPGTVATIQCDNNCYIIARNCSTWEATGPCHQ